MGEQKIESKLYRMFELQRELTTGKEQYEKMLPSYQKIAATLGKIKDDDVVATAKKQFEDDVESIKKGLDNINIRLNAIDLLLKKSDEGDEAREIVGWFVTMIFTALGIDLSDNSDSEAPSEK